MLPVVILAGGLAKRMRPMTETIPKALLPVAGKPFVDRQLSLLQKNGVERVVMCVGHLGEQIEEHVRNSSYEMEILFSYDGDIPLGTGGAIKKAVPLAGNAFFVLYGDSYLEIDYADVENTWKNSGKPALMTVFCNDNRWDTSNVLLENGQIVRYSKTERTGKMRHIDYGLGILTDGVLDEYGQTFDLAAMYSDLSEQGKLEGYEAANRFYEIGSFDGLKELEEKLGQKAVFTDRDGVINPLVYNPQTREYESPHHPEDFAVYTFAEKALRMLRDAGYKIILVSNQPSYAKGKAGLEDINRICKLLEDFSDEHGGLIDSFNYCYHHPDGIVPEYTVACECRKPGTLFLEKAAVEFNLNPERCFFIGDQDGDIECGRSFGCKTISINNCRSSAKRAKPADYSAENLLKAAELILNL